MPLYVGGGIGPLRYYHRIGGGHRRRAPVRPRRPRRPLTDAQAIRRHIAGIVILSLCAVVAVAVVAALV